MVWAMIFGAAAITFLLRFSFLGTLKPDAIPPRVREVLRFVPPAVLAAIVVPATSTPSTLPLSMRHATMVSQVPKSGSSPIQHGQSTRQLQTSSRRPSR